jgi:hypothetical protein
MVRLGWWYARRKHDAIASRNELTGSTTIAARPLIRWSRLNRARKIQQVSPRSMNEAMIIVESGNGLLACERMKKK